MLKEVLGIGLDHFPTRLRAKQIDTGGSQRFGD
jgi:hypothetical protein